MASTKRRRHDSHQGNTNIVDGLVTVVMPMHNSARFLGEAVDSVLVQSYENWELLIVDDASTDDSLNIAEDYAQRDSRIRVLSNSNPIGMPSAPRNEGIRAARGRYLAFLDSDDLWFPQKLEQQLPLFEDSRVAIAYSDYEKISEEGERRNRIVTAPEHATYNSLLKGNVIGNLTGIYDRAKVGTVIVKDQRHEDYVMYLEVLKRGYIARNTGTVLAAYRIRKSSVSSRKMRAIRWQWAIYRHVEKLSLFRSAYYFMFYAVKAFVKSLI